jgi:hypothetical protein
MGVEFGDINTAGWRSLGPNQMGSTVIRHTDRAARLSLSGAMQENMASSKANTDEVRD